MIARLAIVLLALAADPAMAQQADRPGVKAGDRWQFVVYELTPPEMPNRTWVIKGVTSGGIEGTENGELLRLTPELNVIESPRHRDSNPLALSFPLRVGKQWRYTSDWLFKSKGSRGSTVFDVAITSYERVKVPAGDFDAFKVVAKGSLHGVSPINSIYAGQTTATYWYAPSARAIVKSVSHNPYLGWTIVELVELELQP